MSGTSPSELRLAGRIALVTGASRGIGSAIAEPLAAEGAAVAVNYRSGEQAEEVVGAIEAGGGRAVAIQGDVADFADAERLVASRPSRRSAACTSWSTTPASRRTS